jgi:hypothetical protein
MGTNYYLKMDICDKCGREDPAKTLHIGKSSYGWCFSLHVIPGEIPNLSEWQRLFPLGRIFDEYQEEISVEKMFALITERKGHEGKEHHDEEFHRSNHSEPGPKGLLRHRIDSVHCVGHGEGTWDYIFGEFS